MKRRLHLATFGFATSRIDVASVAPAAKLDLAVCEALAQLPVMREP